MAITKGKTERQRDAERKRRARSSEKDVDVPAIKNPARRRRAERDTCLWLRTYLGESFWRPFTDDQRDNIRDIEHAAKFGGDKAIAAPRGDGKTSIGEGVILKCVLTGILRFPLIAAATGNDAQRILEHIKQQLERNNLLADDYPEVCYPIRALEGAPQRAGMQTAGGRRTFLEWKQDYIVLPTIHRSGRKTKASGAVVMTRGLDAAIRGVRVGVMRPDFVLIDDPETRESVKSEEQTKSRRLIIEGDLAGLGGGDKKLARVMLTTIMQRVTNEGNPTISFEYTDRPAKPSWQGRRQKLLKSLPEQHEGLCDEYIAMRQSDFQLGDKYARRSHLFYLQHRTEIEFGAVVSDPARFNSEQLPDGSQAEVSAIQRCYNIIADRGWNAFATEYQNDPPEEAGPIESGITAYRIQRQVNGYARKIIPPGCKLLTQSIDCGKYRLHWVVRAWRPDGTGFTIDYDTTEVHGTVSGSDEGMDLAIRKEIAVRMDQTREVTYCDVDGEVMRVDLTLVDAGWRTDAIYQACREGIAAGLRIMPAMGFGKSAGCAKTNFSELQNVTKDRIPGDGWFLSRRGDIWLVCMDADRWKAWEHDRWMTAPDKPGAMTLWGEGSETDRMSPDEKSHSRYARQITAEVEVDEVKKGVLVRSWKAKSDTNHYLDASYMSCVAANMKGVRLLRPQATPRKQAPVVEQETGNMESFLASAR